MVNKIVLLVAAESWSSFVEGDEESYRLHSQTIWLLSFMNCLYYFAILRTQQIAYELILDFISKVCVHKRVMPHQNSDVSIYLNILFNYTLYFNRSSVTRFGEISPLWQNFQSLGQFLKVNLLFGKILGRLWEILYVMGKILLMQMAKIQK